MPVLRQQSVFRLGGSDRCSVTGAGRLFSVDPWTPAVASGSWRDGSQGGGAKAHWVCASSDENAARHPPRAAQQGGVHGSTLTFVSTARLSGGTLMTRRLTATMG